MTGSASNVDYEGLSLRVSQEGLGSLNPVERVTWLVINTNMEILLGGLYGFYHNSSGDYAAHAVEALEQIGVHTAGQALRDANVLFPGGMSSSEWQPRREQLDRMEASGTDRFDTLTGLLQDASNDEIPDGLERYVNSHARHLPFIPVGLHVG
ncbi:hypothetical protein GCM10008955_32770 [Deinococcus malanensis]|uniref:DNA mimic protein DMP19 C-terminal domain-containing protein n=1 Tax=Deinococcus malanensis TaxID=1706855 RepID=A0ABQ2F0P3_9DEIO|nr:DUF4375 domain-containing protein [Deinococcus malanensis]GGK36366.1 hypothetical protein GCM10008955_32770 [Deinococcus malanensis]